MDAVPLRFIDEQIEVVFDAPPVFSKRPPCPDGFIWRGAPYRVAEMLGEWHDYRRRGAMAHNMRDAHLATAARRGSWGVGRACFRVRTAGGQIFDLYYDRAPRGAAQRGGAWWLYRELARGEEET